MPRRPPSLGRTPAADQRSGEGSVAQPIARHGVVPARRQNLSGAVRPVEAYLRRVRRSNANPNTMKSSRWVVCTFSAPSATKPAASTTSSWSRRPPGRSRLIAIFSLSRRRPHAHLRRRAHQGADVSPRHDRRRAHRIENDFAAASKRRSNRSKRRTSTPANTCSNTTTS